MSEAECVVVYMDESSDLYSKHFETREEAHAFVRDIEDKAILVEGHELRTENYT